MSNHIADANKMVETPRTDDQECDMFVGVSTFTPSDIQQAFDFARQLERELNAANERIKRLEDSGDGLMKSINCGCPYGPSVFNCQTCTNSWDAWRKAKEAKP